MIAKTVTGSDFEGALEYGAGLRSDRTNKQSELLSVANVGSNDARGIAAEMQKVAALSHRMQKPVWHTVLSWAPGEEVSREQKLKAAALYCELMGASLKRHQVAVYEHKDKQHPHIHIYINRVPTDGGPALDTAQNYARNVKATRQIREQLGMQQLPSRRVSTKDLDPHKEVARGYVRDELTAALQDTTIRSLDQLIAHFRQKGIEANLKRDAKGVLVGTSFRYQDSSVKGTEAGVKAKQLRDHFSQYGREALRTSDQVTPTVSSGRAPGAESASAGSGVAPQSNELLDTNPNLGAGVDDAQRNENELRRRRRRRPRL
ncbi:relaxase/mobilization nuclease domain-containing protein [Hymenobacter sp. GOD-10R]|uniref:relaxase/mobilization nuclease domain-containing protein n=1 Tax=Hymenobacter sp. GOD-10R TaxID=3093922 RepID=UPI002D76E2C2|nr:relaxase/mobilization nuclease domain-containing protein [Hymenobacter sp. GOD-10R]WRQ31621.1 relaxase/mobilization nuclease domain-containing protein [Hymenobacter sp. GOD-10R]